MHVYVELRTKIPRTPSRGKIERFVQKTLTILGIPCAKVAVVFTSDREIRRFNKKYLRHDRPTDVLAFGGQKVRPPTRRSFLLGDIMISLDRAKAHARRFKTTPLEELELYIVHGILHLLGYDDHAPFDRKRMRRKEALVLKRLHEARVRL